MQIICICLLADVGISHGELVKLVKCEHGHDHSHDHLQNEWVDRAGIWFSSLCLIHCALTPLLFALIPAFFWGGDYTHLALALVLPVLAFAAFIPGFRRHADWLVLGLGFGGLILIVSALWAPSSASEIALTVNGSLILIGAHWRNRRLKSKLDKCPKTQVYG